MKPMQVREFTEEGVREFERILDEARNGHKIPDSLRNGLLESGGLARIIAPNIFASPARFASRLEAGNHLVRLLAPVKFFRIFSCCGIPKTCAPA